MASLTRTLTETLSVADFLNAETPFGFGHQQFFSLVNQEAFGSYDSHAMANQGDFGNVTPELHELHNFAPLGSDTALRTNLTLPAVGSASVIARLLDFAGQPLNDNWGLNHPRTLTETLAIASDVDIDGAFIRTLTETLDVIARTGLAKGLFFRESLSDIVTANNQIRQLLEIPGTGEIAASERKTTGALKFLRYIPGTTPGTANTVDLGALPTDVGSQGWLFDDSPHGVFLRGSWEAKVIVADSQATGSVRVSVNMFVVTADTTGVVKVSQIGPSKTSSPFSPAITPSQLTFSWTFEEVGEIFVGDDQYLYLEVILEELTHPGTTAFAKLRMDDVSHSLFSELHTPGVADSTTYNVAPDAEVLSIADVLAFVVGFNRSLSESLSIADSLAQNIDFQRDLSETLSISDLLFAAKNVLLEVLDIVDDLDRQVVYLRPLTETLAIDATVLAGALSPNYVMMENLNIQDFVTFSITRNEKPLRIGGLNRAAIRPIRVKKYGSLK